MASRVKRLTVTTFTFLLIVSISLVMVFSEKTSAKTTATQVTTKTTIVKKVVLPSLCADYKALDPSTKRSRLETGSGNILNQHKFNHLGLKDYAHFLSACLYGWNTAECNCLDRIWQGESSWRWNAGNPHGCSYGIPQACPASKLRSAGADWLTNPRTQIRWGLSYIAGRRDYGRPSRAHFAGHRPCTAGY